MTTPRTIDQAIKAAELAKGGQDAADAAVRNAAAIGALSTLPPPQTAPVR